MIRSLIKIVVMGIVFMALAGFSAYFTITFLIRGETKITVPDLVGRDLVYVLETLTELGLNTRIRGSEYSGEIPKNHVMAQSPAPGEQIKKGREIRITISKGAKSLAMPNLTDLDLRQAQLILEENGICLGRLSKGHHPGVVKDAVIAHTPPPGLTFFRDQCADLLISLGPMPVEYRMPDLSGLYLEQAIRRIEEQRLRVGDIRSIFGKDRPVNIILNQDPAAGSMVLRDSLVDLDDRLPEGYLRHHVRLILRAFGMTVIMHDQLMQPCTDIWLLIPAHVHSAVFLYVNDVLVETQFFD